MTTELKSPDHRASLAECPLCGGKDWVILTMRARWNIPATNVVCKSCGLVFMNPRPSSHDVARYYRSGEYKRLYKLPHIDLENLAEIDRQTGLSFLAFFDRELGWPAGRVLDVGCLSGGIVSRFADRGWQAEGVEPDPAAATFASERFGLTVQPKLLQEAELPDRYYDLIVLSHVLEHMEEPASVLRLLAQKVRSGGALLVEVPNLAAPTGRYLDFFHHDHLFNFSPVSLTRLLTLSGWRVVATDPSARNLRIVATEGQAAAGAEMLKDDFRRVRSNVQAFRRWWWWWWFRGWATDPRRVRETLFRTFARAHRKLSALSRRLERS